MFERSDAASVYASAAQLAEKLRNTASKEDSEWRVFNVLHRVCCYFVLFRRELLFLFLCSLLRK